MLHTHTHTLFDVEAFFWKISYFQLHVQLTLHLTDKKYSKRINLHTHHQILSKLQVVIQPKPKSRHTDRYDIPRHFVRSSKVIGPYQFFKHCFFFFLNFQWSNFTATCRRYYNSIFDLADNILSTTHYPFHMKRSLSDNVHRSNVRYSS